MVVDLVRRAIGFWLAGEAVKSFKDTIESDDLVERVTKGVYGGITGQISLRCFEPDIRKEEEMKKYRLK